MYHPPTERYNVISDMTARGHLPRLISLQVRGLQSGAEWDVSDVGSMLLVKAYSFSFLVGV